MQNESGRSLFEIIGVMAIAAVMTASALGVYNTMRHNQQRTIAAAELKQLAADTKLLMSMRDGYDGVSVDYLVKAGALRSADAPIGGPWQVAPTVDGTGFEITLTQLSRGECAYFAAARPAWASALRVNGVAQTDTGDDDNCFTTATNQVTFVVE